MAPKKSKKAKELPEEPQQIHQQLLGQIRSLERLVLARTEENAKLRQTCEHLEEQARVTKQQAEQEYKDRIDTTADMTRQFKAMQDELLKDIADRERGIEKTRAQGARERIQLENEIREKEDILQKREQEILDLQHRLDQLNKEFSAVLRSTLASVAEKIEAGGPKDDPKVELSADPQEPDQK